MPANHCGRRSPTNDAASPASAAPVRKIASASMMSRANATVRAAMPAYGPRGTGAARPNQERALPCALSSTCSVRRRIDQVVRERRRLARHCDPHLGARCDVLDDALELRAVEDTVGDLGREAARDRAVGKSPSHLVVERRRDRVLELREETISATTRSTTRCSASERATASGSEPASALSTVRSSSGAESTSPAAASRLRRPPSSASEPSDASFSLVRLTAELTPKPGRAPSPARSAARPAVAPARTLVTTSPTAMSRAFVARLMLTGSQRPTRPTSRVTPVPRVKRSPAASCPRRDECDLRRGSGLPCARPAPAGGRDLLPGAVLVRPAGRTDGLGAPPHPPGGRRRSRLVADRRTRRRELEASVDRAVVGGRATASVAASSPSLR